MKCLIHGLSVLDDILKGKAGSPGQAGEPGHPGMPGLMGMKVFIESPCSPDICSLATVY